MNMKPEFQAKFLQYLNTRKKEDEGFTLIELLVVIIFLGILAAITMPSLLGQPGKAKQSEARNNVGAIVRAQQAFNLEKSVYTTDPVALGIGVRTQSLNYKYLFAGTPTGTAPIAVSNVAVPIKPALRAYAGIVATGFSDPNNTAASDVTSIGIVCESVKYTTTATPTFTVAAPGTTNGNQLDCTQTTTIAPFEGGSWKALGQ